MSFAPALGARADATRWRMDVLGSPVSPLDVVDMGTRWLHAVGDGGVFYDARDEQGAAVRVRSWDAAVVAPGDAEHLLWYDGYAQPDLAGGFHFNLWNNVWGTAFPQWYGDNGVARFALELDPPQA